MSAGEAIRFEFATTARIIFGEGTIREVGELAAQYGTRALVVTGRSGKATDRLEELLSKAGVHSTQFSVEKEPTIGVVQEGVKLARTESCELVLGYGGGSAIDAGKAVSALLTNPGEVLDYLEVIGNGQPLKKPPVPYIAVPTTAGTGAEVTRNAVLASPEHRVKVSLRSPLMLPDIALIDPEETYSLPPHVTASTGLDALTQVIEPFVSHLSNPLTDAVCREGIMRAACSLRKVNRDGSECEARRDMALASLMGGLALANAKLGAVHGFAGPLGGMYPAAPHGVVCGKLLPYVIAGNLKALRSRAPGSKALQRYAEVAQILTGDSTATVESGVIWIEDLCAELSLPGLRDYGVSVDAIDLLIQKAQNASSMQGNPIKLTSQELEGIISAAL